MQRREAERTDLPPDHQQCYICEEVMPNTDFHFNANRKTGRAQYCKLCDQLRIRAYRSGYLAGDVKRHMKAGTLQEMNLGKSGVLPVRTTAVLDIGTPLSAIMLLVMIPSRQRNI
jgi:hypothetical protein